MIIVVVAVEVVWKHDHAVQALHVRAVVKIVKMIQQNHHHQIIILNIVNTELKVSSQQINDMQAHKNLYIL